MVREKYISSPCIQKCVINVEGLCDGCGRKQEEIWMWKDLSPQQRKEIVKRSKRYLVR